jgi:ubiquinone/menaquinone biosynthesis C-methylase UbiE
MNLLHHWLCRSDRWRNTLQLRVPWVIGDADLGSNVLELGPGPGLTTELLQMSLKHLTVLELDPKFAHALAAHFQEGNVQVVEGNATDMPFGNAEFSGAVSFTMLHHVPSPELQDRLLREVFRVLQPGGVFVGSDSLMNWFMRIIHIGDTLIPVSPDTFGTRLQDAGFEVLEVKKNTRAFGFRARRPTA